MNEWGWFALTAGGITLVCLVVAWVIGRRASARARLAALRDDESVDLAMGDMTEALSRGLPGEERDRQEILPELVRAGYYGSTALAEYRAVRAALILTPIFGAAAIALLVEPQQMPYVAFGGLVLAALGYSLPRLYVTLSASARSREIERGLPVFADMLSIALLAGQGLMGAMRRVTEQLRTSFPRLAEELMLVIRQADLLNLNVAFEQWANRSQLPEVRNLAVILNQSQMLGNEVTAALMEYSTNLRTNVRQRVDAKAQRAAFWMLFPTILCLWIPAAVVLIGPVYFEFAARRAKAREQIPQFGPNSDIQKLLKRGDTGENPK